MSSAASLPGSAASGLLVDTNLLVLWVVGGVNRNRIETFKRTSNYTKTDHDFLRRVLASFETLYTVPHVLAEVSNLTDLPGAERQQARSFLKRTISLLKEVEMRIHAAEDVLYPKLGLVDAAIGAVARVHRCAVLTDDQELYLRLSHERVNVIYFSYLR
jgi:rRNA-processing protein FCF1